MALLFGLPVAMAAGRRPRASFLSLQHRPASHRPLRRQTETDIRIPATPAPDHKAWMPRSWSFYVNAV